MTFGIYVKQIGDETGTEHAPIVDGPRHSSPRLPLRATQPSELMRAGRMPRQVLRGSIWTATLDCGQLDEAPKDDGLRRPRAPRCH
ncbi:hypothetical protein Aduo_019576 [Ancylostoma duodenale]